MGEIKWIKLSTEMFGDDKIMQIRAMPDGDAMLLIWINLLLMAGRVNDGGLIYLTHGVPYTDQMLSVALNRPLLTVQTALKVFSAFRMIEETPDGLLISNWEKHQNIEGMERARAATRERVRKFREKKKAELLPENTEKSADVTACNENVTECNGEVTVQNKNKNKKEEIYITNTPPIYDTTYVGNKRREGRGEENNFREGVSGDGPVMGGVSGVCENESGEAQEGPAGFGANGVRSETRGGTDKERLDWRDFRNGRLH